MRGSVRAPWWWVLAVTAGMSCAGKRAAVVLRVESEVPWGDGGIVRAVRVRVWSGDTTNGTPRLDYRMPLGRRAGAVSLPLRVGVLPLDDDHARVVTAEARGCVDEACKVFSEHTVEARAVFGFVEAEQRELTLLLAARCLGVQCSGTQTCVAATGTCSTARVDIRNAPAAGGVTTTVPLADVPRFDGNDAAIDRVVVDAPDVVPLDGSDATIDADVVEPSDITDLRDATEIAAMADARDAPTPHDVVDVPSADAACATACPASTVCHAGSCVSRCDPRVLERANAGCDFLATITPNSQLGSSFAYAVVLVNTQSYTVDVTISGGALTTPIMRTVPASGTVVVSLPWVFELAQFDGLYGGCPSATSPVCRMSPPARSALRRRGAYRIIATSPIVVHQLNPFEPQAAGNVALTGDGATLFPSHALGTEHTVLTFSGNSTRRRDARAFFAIAATTGDTTVTVRTTAPLVAGMGVAAVAVDGTPTYTLGEGDVLLLVAETSTDPSGTTISSNHPVAVITGRDCATSTPGSVECDHIEEALPSNETAGREYVVALPRETAGATATVRVMSLSASTVVSYTPPTLRAPDVLGLRQVVEFPISSSVRVVSSRAVMVAQSREPAVMDAGGAALGDPTMVFEAPVRQWRTTSPFLVPARYTSTFATVVVPPASNPTLDASPLMGVPELVAGYAIYTVPLSAGRHRIAAGAGAPSSGNESFVKVHGSAPYVSFAYPASTELRAINTD